jgi:hypothetical protein
MPSFCKELPLCSLLGLRNKFSIRLKAKIVDLKASKFFKILMSFKTINQEHGLS